MISGIRVRGFLPIGQLLKEGVLTADGTEQIMIEVSGLIKIEGYVDLSQMRNEDIITLRRYVRISANGGYKLYGEETYVGAQTQPLIRFPPIIVYHGMKITLQQTGGTFKTFPYQFFKVT